MQLLNPGGLKGPTYCKPPALGRVSVFRLRGTDGVLRRIAFDPDSLAAWRLGPAELPPEPEGVEPDFPLAVNSGAGAIVLSPTRGCNLRCTYCFVRHETAGTPGSAPAAELPERAVAQAAELFDPRLKVWRVSFFGGEPLTAWASVVLAVLKLKELAGDRQVRFSLTTNGTLLTAQQEGDEGMAEDRLDFLDREGFSLIVSIDGPAGLHDRHRRDATGGGSYARIARALGILREFPRLAARTSLRATWLPAQSETEARLEELNRWCDSGAAANAAVEPASGCAARETGGEYSAGEIARAIAAGAAWCVRRVRDGKPGRFSYLWKALRRLLDRRPQGSNCGAGSGYLAVTPDGGVYACHKGNFLVGTVWNGVRRATTAPWADNRWYARRRCANCWARNLCGGGCRADSWSLHGSLVTPTRTSCAVGKGRALAALGALAELGGSPEALDLLKPRLGSGAPCS